jgi:glycosyltransferase involved in cell wall biosynthesis
VPLTSTSDPGLLPVALVIAQLELGGGAERQLAALACGLPEHGFLPRVVNLRGGPEHGEWRPENYWARYLRERGVEVLEVRRAGNRDLLRLLPLARFLRRERPVIVHSFLFTANAYARTAVLLSSPVRRPILIASERSGLPNTRVEKLVDRWLEPLTDGILTNAHFVRETLRSRGSRTPVWVVPNGIDPIRFPPERRLEARARLNLRAEDPVIGIVARMSIEKNYPFFIELVRRLHTRIPGLRAVAIGDGPLRAAVERGVAQAGLENVLRLVGRVDHVPDLLPALDVFLLVSDHEALSNAIMEAQAAGLPCVVSAVGGNGEIVEDGRTGFLAPPRDLSRFEERVLALLADPALRQRLGNEARRRMETRFSMPAMISSTVLVYRELLRARGSGATGLAA